MFPLIQFYSASSMQGTLKDEANTYSEKYVVWCCKITVTVSKREIGKIQGTCASRCVCSLVSYQAVGAGEDGFLESWLNNMASSEEQVPWNAWMSDYNQLI